MRMIKRSVLGPDKLDKIHFKYYKCRSARRQTLIRYIHYIYDAYKYKYNFMKQLAGKRAQYQKRTRRKFVKSLCTVKHLETLHMSTVKHCQNLSLQATGVR